MESLENQIRESLIEKRADETYKLMETPKYQSMMKDITETMMKYMFDALGDDEFRDKNLSSVMTERDGELSKLFSNPEQLRQVAYQRARNQYMTRDQIEAQLEEMYGELNEDGDFGDEAMRELRKANEKLYGFIEHQNRIVSGLAEIAKRDGIERALTDEAEYEVIKGICPTADEYIAHSLGGIQTIKEYLANVQNAMMMDGEIGQAMGAMYSGMQKAIEGMQDMNEQVQRDKIHQKAKEIYGE